MAAATDRDRDVLLAAVRFCETECEGLRVGGRLQSVGRGMIDRPFGDGAGRLHTPDTVICGCSRRGLVR